MKTKLLKIGLVTGFIALISGLVLATIGVSTQGLEQLESATAPEEVHLTYDKIDSLDLNFYNKQVVIEESPDQQVHVRYFEFTYLSQKLKVTAEAGHLSISNTYAGVSNAYPVRTFGELLNRDKRDSELLTIQIPKETVLSKVDIVVPNYDMVTISNQHIKELNSAANLNLTASQVDGGQWNIYDHWFHIEDSQIKDITITQTSSAELSIQNSRLENVAVRSDGVWSRFIADQVTLAGDVTIEGYYAKMDINLADDSKTTTSLDISLDDMPKNTYYDEDLEEWVEDDDAYDYSYSPSEPSSLTLSDQLKQDADINEELRFKKTVKDEKAKLRIVGLGGNQVTIK